MARAPFQVGIFPYRKTIHKIWEFAIFKRSTEGYWQSIAGGGEDNETPEEAAAREAFEEAGIPSTCIYRQLQTIASAPVIHFGDRHHWDANLLVIPIYYFGVDTTDQSIRLSHEHSEFQWIDFEEGQRMLKWDSDQTALWELNQTLQRGMK